MTILSSDQRPEVALNPGSIRPAGSPIFPNDPTRARFVSASFASVREAISGVQEGRVTDVSTIWGTPHFTGIAERQAFRPDKGEFRGTFTDGNDRMPYVGFWLSDPQKNMTILLEDGDIEVDKTLVDWFRIAGIGGDCRIVADATEMASFLGSLGHGVYSCDNYGPSMDPLSVNTRHDFDLVSSKSWVTRLVGRFAPFEERLHMFSTPITNELFERVRGSGSRIFVKLCNDEHGGMGVKPASTFEELSAIVEGHKHHTASNGLNPELVLQRGIEGISRSFCLFLDPKSNAIPVIAVTDQMVDPHTGRDLGNRHYPLTADVIGPLTPMIETVRDNIARECPNAFGFVMCDFIQTEEGEVFAIDPGLRPSASSPSAMAQLWVHRSTGEYPYVRNNQTFGFVPGMTWKEFCDGLPALTDPVRILTEGRGVVPFSWEHKHGTGRVITIARDESDHGRLIAEITATYGDFMT